MDLSAIFIIAIALLAIITAVVEVFKKTLNISPRYLPITSIVVGIFIAILIWPLTEYSLYLMIVAGIVSGLASSGTFDLLKASNKKDDSK
ncbi:phage holin family protein [Ureibacillus chungkukjangi]|uniref:holin n=1 Tax=Ureibacillus chungkukjangi TaxID=1202712 RepID=UPI00384C6068